MAKKTKKIETPIDQRETFVSIQKNFADSDLSVAEKLKTLYVLQQADTAIDKIHQLRGELPVEVENLENEIADLNAKANRMSEMIDEYGKFITENLGKAIKFTVIDTVTVRAWDRAANALSKTETREQKVYNADWVE